MQTNLASFSSAARFNANYGANPVSHRAGHRQNANLKFGFEPVTCTTAALGCCAIPCIIPVGLITAGLAWLAWKFAKK